MFQTTLENMKKAYNRVVKEQRSRRTSLKIRLMDAAIRLKQKGVPDSENDYLISYKRMEKEDFGS